MSDFGWMDMIISLMDFFGWTTVLVNQSSLGDFLFASPIFACTTDLVARWWHKQGTHTLWLMCDWCTCLFMSKTNACPWFSGYTSLQLLEMCWCRGFASGWCVKLVLLLLLACDERFVSGDLWSGLNSSGCSSCSCCSWCSYPCELLLMNCLSSGGGKGFISPSLCSPGRQLSLATLGDSLACVCVLCCMHPWWLAVGHAHMLCVLPVCMCVPDAWYLAWYLAVRRSAWQSLIISLHISLSFG